MAQSDYKSFYEQELGLRLPRPNSEGEVSVACPLHHDEKPSMSVNIETGLWKCFTCDVGGSPYDFYMELHGVNFQEAQRAIDGEDFLPTVDKSSVSRWHKALMRDKKLMVWLKRFRGLEPDTIARFKLGYDGERITIPIYDHTGRVMNVRRYAPEGAGGQKMMSFKSGFGLARLFPIENFGRKTVVLTEGELDCILLNQLGFPAVTSTGGASTWKREWSNHFRNKVVYIVYDIDEQGRKGASKVANALQGVAKRVHVVSLPITTPDNGDVTDYFLTHGFTAKDFKKLCKGTPPLGEHREYAEGGPGEIIPENINDPIDLHLSNASHRDYLNKAIRMNVIVAGKDLAPFIVPKTVLYSCDMSEGKKCLDCFLGNVMGNYSLTFNDLNPILLEFMDCPTNVQKGLLRQEIKIPPRCRAHEIDVREAYNIEEVFLMPEIDFSCIDSQYVIRKAYAVGHGLRTNRLYSVQGVTVPDPRRQYATHLMNSATPAVDDIGSFDMDKETINSLKVFRPGRGQSVDAKMRAIAADHTANVTHIYGRDDLSIAIDLVYHSVIGFNFQHKPMDRGWLELCVVGDTRTGKSETFQAKMNHYRMGELVTGENASFAGLVGGLQQNQNRWSLTWGKIPQNDRRLVCVDEFSSMSHEMISRMSGMRSSGVAEVTKIQTERTHARTRLIFMGNPRNGAAINSFAFGVNAIRDLVGAPEDIARFDFAMACASADVGINIINAEFNEHERESHVHTSELCNLLIRWVWSRTAEQVKFEDGVEKRILELATEQGQRYVNRIPLVEAANHRMKLARIAVATAARLFSTDASGQNIIVKKSHAEFAAKFLDELYGNPALGYAEFSRQQLRSVEIAEEARPVVAKLLGQEQMLAEIFSQHTYVRVSDLDDMLDCGRDEAKHYIKQLFQAKMLYKVGRNGYKKSPAFIEILREFNFGRES